ncbi:MAG: FMN-binding protein [Flavobacteriales bacterium]|nr:MAG: FMN-binding protein [Flavobacteriales bacterium]
MKTIYQLLFILLTLFWGCKQKATPDQQSKTTDNDTEVAVKAPLPAIIKDLGQFAGLDIPDVTAADQMVHFKKINGIGDIETIDHDTYLKLYQLIIKSGSGAELPIFELRESGNTILLVSGKGFAGPIWAKVLVDLSTQEIIKIEFDHRSESEGYGAGISASSFKNQFMDAKLNVKANTYGLAQTGQILVEGMQVVDGISGATTTSRAAIGMVNAGMQKYAEYLMK